jgi:hypothetical protein
MGATEINDEQNRMLSVSRSPSRSCCAQTSDRLIGPARATSRQRPLPGELDHALDRPLLGR